MDPPGEAEPDWAIAARFARRLHELYLEDRKPADGEAGFSIFEWRTDEDVFIHARYQFDGGAGDPMEGYAGVTYDLLQPARQRRQSRRPCGW